ncbi:proline dehydrogenase [bacterium]|nr:proline dehydrogenase [bacterium]
MLRQSLLYLSTAGWARGIATHWSVARRVARRFVAGETMDEAIQVARQLLQQNIFSTLDYLGESVSSEADTHEVVDTYQRLIQRIAAENLRATVSVKPTHVGLDISEDLCLTNLRHILSTGKAHGVGVTLDMEGSSHTERTITLYRTLRDEYDFHNAGTVIQAYLYRSEEDMLALSQEDSHIRLCKGAYLEPPTVAFPLKADVDANYVRLAKVYLQAHPSSYLCLATHDENMIHQTEQFLRSAQIPPARYEYQMLYGVRSERQRELARSHTMRVYVPFGTAWYPYFVRRLAERPANVWFIVKNVFA